MARQFEVPDARQPTARRPTTAATPDAPAASPAPCLPSAGANTDEMRDEPSLREQGQCHSNAEREEGSIMEKPKGRGWGDRLNRRADWKN